MSELSKKEKAWIKKVQKALNECPSERIGFYTIGDNDIYAFDVTKMDEINEVIDKERCADFGITAKRLCAAFNESLFFPNPVESTAG